MVGLFSACVPSAQHERTTGPETEGRAEASRQTIRIKDRFPAFSPVGHAAIDEFARQVDSLYRAQDTRGLIAFKVVGRELTARRDAFMPGSAARSLGFALMKIHSAVQVEQSPSDALSFISDISALWDHTQSRPDSLGTELLFLKGKAFQASGYLSKAGICYSTAGEKALKRGHTARASAFLRTAAYAALDGGDIQGSRALFDRIIALHEEVQDTSLLAGTLMASLAAYPDSSTPVLDRVKRLLPGVRMPLAAGMYYSIRGRYLAQSERTASGLTLFKQAINCVDTIAEKTNEEAYALAIYLHNTGYACQNLGDMEAAEVYGSRAVELNETLMQVADPLEARNARDRLAENLESVELNARLTEKYGTGPARHMSVLKLRQERRPPDPVMVAKTYANIASMYFYWDSLGIDSVLKYAGLCLEGPCRGETIASLHLQAHGLLHKGRHSEALNALEKACAVLSGNDGFNWGELERTKFPKNIWTVEKLGTFEEVAEILQRKDPSIRALHLLERMTEVQSRLIDSLFMVEGSDLGKLIRSRELMTARLIRNAWPKVDEVVRDGQVDSIFAWMDDDKSMAFRRDRYLMERSDQRELKAARNEHREELSAVRQRGAPATDAEILRLSSVIDSIEAIMAKAPPAQGAPTRVDMELAHRLRTNLHPRTGLLSYRLTKNDLFAVYLDKDTVMLHRSTRSAEFDQALTILTNDHHGIDSLNTMSKPLLEAMRVLLPRPFAERRPRELVIIPSGDLCYLPFEALPLNVDGQALGDSAALRYALSASILVGEHSNSVEDGGAEVFAFAPHYGTSLVAEAREERSANVLSGDEQRAKTGPLLHNEEEVTTVASDIVAKTFTGSSADERAFKDALPNAQLLHLAMHAYSDNEPSRSGLVFTADAISFTEGRSAAVGSAEDGVFHAYELLTRPLRADLLVLSACETGQGVHQSGEGVRSLARAFMLAGARSTVSSLWKVDDRATKEIMVKFYEHLAEGMGKADALAEAKRWYRKENPNAPPSHWASFILIGDNEPVHLKKRSPVRPWMIAIGVVLLMGGAYLVLRKRRARMAA